MRLEGLRVEGDASGGQLVAQALGEVVQLAGGGDAEPERRVARAAELAQTCLLYTSFGDRLRIEKPASLAAEYRDYLAGIVASYGE